MAKERYCRPTGTSSFWEGEGQDPLAEGASLTNHAPCGLKNPFPRSKGSRQRAQRGCDVGRKPSGRRGAHAAESGGRHLETARRSCRSQWCVVSAEKGNGENVELHKRLGMVKPAVETVDVVVGLRIGPLANYAGRDGNVIQATAGATCRKWRGNCTWSPEKEMKRATNKVCRVDSELGVRLSHEDSGVLVRRLSCV